MGEDVRTDFGDAAREYNERSDYSFPFKPNVTAQRATIGSWNGIFVALCQP